jgi:hypothetical protein
MKKVVIWCFLFFGFAITGYNKSNRTAISTYPKERLMLFDTSKIAIISMDKFEDANAWFGKSKKANLDSMEIVEIEKLFITCMTNYNDSIKRHAALNRYNKSHKALKEDWIIKNWTIDFLNYKRQYVAFVNGKGEKEVWINCFCSRNPDWKENIFRVIDGGNCFFQLYVNLSTHTYHNLSINGEA